MNIINPKPLIQNLLKIKQRPKFSRKTDPYEDLKEKLYAVDEVKKVRKEKWPDINPTIIEWIKDTKKLTIIGKADEKYKIRHTLKYTIKDIAKEVKKEHVGHKIEIQTPCEVYVKKLAYDFITFWYLKKTLEKFDEFKELDKTMDEFQQFYLFGMAAFGTLSKKDLYNDAKNMPFKNGSGNAIKKEDWIFNINSFNTEERWRILKKQSFCFHIPQMLTQWN